MSDASCGPFEEDARADLAPELSDGGLDLRRLFASLRPAPRTKGDRRPGGAPTGLAGVALAVAGSVGEFWVFTTQPYEANGKDASWTVYLLGHLVLAVGSVLFGIVRGCMEYQHDGLGEPEQVRNATSGYRAEQDTLAAFFEARCVIHPNASAGATPLYDSYKAWCDESGETRLTQTRFGRQLRERGFSSKKAQTVTWYGIGLRDDRPDPDRGYQGGVVDGSDPDPGREGGPEVASDSPNRLKVDGSSSNGLRGESRIGTRQTPQTM